jgi:hypothetical protein
MQNEFYDTGWNQATYYLYGSDKQKNDAEKVYERFCSQDDFLEDETPNKNKINFISGWTHHLID